jgi:tetratricopeptide (TPR) repeat protein
MSEETQKGDGFYFKRNYTEAFKCYKNAAEAGDKHALLFLACMYEQGEGTDKNEILAETYYLQSAQEGDELIKYQAMNQLGIIYAHKGEYQKAHQYFQDAAAGGNAAANANKGFLHALGFKDGKGIPDKKLSFWWKNRKNILIAVLAVLCVFFAVYMLYSNNGTIDSSNFKPAAFENISLIAAEPDNTDEYATLFIVFPSDENPFVHYIITNKKAIRNNESKKVVINVPQQISLIYSHYNKITDNSTVYIFKDRHGGEYQISITNGEPVALHFVGAKDIAYKIITVDKK